MPVRNPLRGAGELVSTGAEHIRDLHPPMGDFEVLSPRDFRSGQGTICITARRVPGLLPTFSTRHVSLVGRMARKLHMKIKWNIFLLTYAVFCLKKQRSHNTNRLDSTPNP